MAFMCNSPNLQSMFVRQFTESVRPTDLNCPPGLAYRGAALFIACLPGMAYIGLVPCLFIAWSVIRTIRACSKDLFRVYPEYVVPHRQTNLFSTINKAITCTVTILYILILKLIKFGVSKYLFLKSKQQCIFYRLYHVRLGGEC